MRGAMKRIASYALILTIGTWLGCASNPPAPTGNPPSPDTAAPDPDASQRDPFILGQTRFRQGRFNEAEALFAHSAETSGKNRAEALFFQGESLMALKRHEDALLCFDQVLKLNPNLTLLRETLQRKYRIGVDFLLGNATSSFLGLFSYRSPAYGVAILDRLVRDYPYESFSDVALYNMANYYFRSEQWNEAQPVYERLIESYPASEWVPPAYFQLGKVIYNSIKGHKYDPQPIRQARWHFERFLQQRQKGPEAKEARDYIQILQNMEAQYELYVGRFYLRDDNVKGARIHFEAAVAKGRDADGELTEAARAARDLLISLADQE